MSSTTQPIGSIISLKHHLHDAETGDIYTAGTGIAITDSTISNSGVISVNEQTGAVAITGGSGISIANNVVSNTGVISVNGQTGAVTLTVEGGTVYTAGPGISVSGSTISNTGVLSVNGQTGNVSITTGGTYTAGTGISISGSTISNSGVTSVNGQTGAVTITAEGGAVYTGGAGIVIDGSTIRANFGLTSNTVAEGNHSHTGYATAIHNHSADAITTGVLPTRYGGTGLSGIVNNCVIMGNGFSTPHLIEVSTSATNNSIVRRDSNAGIHAKESTIGESSSDRVVTEARYAHGYSITLVYNGATTTSIWGKRDFIYVTVNGVNCFRFDVNSTVSTWNLKPESSTANYNIGSSSYRYDGIYLKTSPSVSSDIRYKDVTRNFIPGLDFITKLEPVAFVKTDQYDPDQLSTEIESEEWVEAKEPYTYTEEVVEYIDGKYVKYPKTIESERTIQEEVDIYDANGVVVDREIRPKLIKKITYKPNQIMGVRKHWGLIAQEVKQVMDDLNLSSQDFAGWQLADVNDPESTQSLRYEQFIAPLIQAVKELSAEVEVLKSQIQNPV